MAIAELDEPLSDDAFIEFGSRLGHAMPERDPAVLPYVDQDVLLNLFTEHGRTRCVSLQPFATNFLSLHTEGSGRRAEQQPRYIVLMCCDPGDDATAAQTVLVPMAAVERSLPSGDIELLSQTRYRSCVHGPFIVRQLEDRAVFSFRDFMSDTLEWVHAGDEEDPEVVRTAIVRLLGTMYEVTAASGVYWRRGMLVVIDNTFFFHGKTAGPVAAPSRRRHLKRLRIV
ncbi:MAG: TauD/TfdA family dioxygenase [Egibacteraceae bacterium]